MKRHLTTTVLLLLLVSGHAFAQNKIRIEKADALEGGNKASGEAFQKLVGNVELVQGQTRIFGDSVILYRERNFTEVFGKTVRVEEGDSITVTGKGLTYNGDEKLAKMRGDVVYRDPSMTLYTDYLDYNMLQNLAYYYQGGRLVDTANVLTSQEGAYRTNTHLAAFKDSVVLTAPEYVLRSDTLEYNTVTKIAYTFGPTEITSQDSTVLYAEAGSEFKTTEKQSIFGIGTIETPDYVISADQLFFDDVSQWYTGKQNVEMVSKDNDVIIIGDSAIYQRELGRATVFGRPLMKKVMEGDTLYLSADTLVSIEDSIPANERILAYHDVKIYRDDLQGIADSLAYHITDSLLFFFQDPVLWAETNQIVADSINLAIRGGTIDRMNTVDNSFVISIDTLNNYNQIKGRDMTARFVDGQINRIDVFGNGESVFYALQGDSMLVGMNRILCSDIRIDMAESQVKGIHTYVKPEASFIPPHEITEEERKLAGFNWRRGDRPTKQDVLNPQPKADALEDEFADNLPSLPSELPPVQVPSLLKKAKNK